MRFLRMIGATAVLAMMSAGAYAEESGFRVSGGADLVSRYVWRGMDQGSGFSVQPTLELGLGGFSLGAWGSLSVSQLEAKEVDVYFSYSVEGFTAMLTDYFWMGESARYGCYPNDHFIELGLSYTISEKVPLSFGWNTMLFCGKSGELDEDGKRMFSTCITVDYDFDVKGVSLKPGIGITPWKGQYADGFAVMDVSLTATKAIVSTEKFELPLFVQFIVSPEYDKAYLIAGASFAF